MTVPPTDILTTGKLKNLPNYKIFRLRHPTLAPHKTLHNWSFKLIIKNNAYKPIVMGYINNNTLIQSSFIRNADHNMVVTENGTVYRIERFVGELPHPLFDRQLVELFRQGFPTNWKDIVDKECARIKKIESGCEKSEGLMKNVDEDVLLESAKEKVFMSYLNKLRKEDEQLKNNRRSKCKELTVDVRGKGVFGDSKINKMGNKNDEAIGNEKIDDEYEVSRKHSENDKAIENEKVNESNVKENLKNTNDKKEELNTKNTKTTSIFQKINKKSLKENKKHKTKRRKHAIDNLVKNDAYDTDRSSTSCQSVKKGLRLSIAVKKGTETVSKLCKSDEKGNENATVQQEGNENAIKQQERSKNLAVRQEKKNENATVQQEGNENFVVQQRTTRKGSIDEKFTVQQKKKKEKNITINEQKATRHKNKKNKKKQNQLSNNSCATTVVQSTLTSLGAQQTNFNEPHHEQKADTPIPSDILEHDEQVKSQSSNVKPALATNNADDDAFRGVRKKMTTKRKRTRLTMPKGFK